MKVVYIYSLEHPETKQIRYIGKTTNIKRRLSQHIQDGKKHISNKRITNWLYNLSKQNLKPVIKVIEKCNENNWAEREIYWIAYYKNLFDLCNHHEGGLGCSGRNLTESQKLHIKNVGLKQSYFNEDEKLLIWKEIQKDVSYNQIIIKYPKLSISSYNSIKNGRLWNHITHLSKPIKSKHLGTDNHKSRKVICNTTSKTWESARQAWLELYKDKYKYSYFRCMLSGYNTNKTTLSYI